MFQSDAHGYAFGLYVHLRLGEIAVDVAGGMAGGENDRTTIGLFRACLQVYGFHSRHRLALDDEPCHLGLEVHLTSTP